MLPIHNDTNTEPTQRLKSRKPTWKLTQKLISKKFDMNVKCNDAEWKIE